jgi:hypothetical protein
VSAGAGARTANLAAASLAGVSLVAAASLAGCAAPPLGFGTSARIPGPAGTATFEARTAVGLGPGRQTYQAELSSTFRPRRWFAGELGVVGTHLAQDVDGGGTLNLNGVWPYLRPHFFVDRVSLAIGLSGLGFGGGGGGIIGGIADAQLGYGTERWTVYAGAYRHYFELVAEDAIVASSSQLRAGGQLTVHAGRGRLGVAVELERQRDDLRNDPHQQTSRFWGGALKLSYTSPAFR